jgi:hypothetical protein
MWQKNVLNRPVLSRDGTDLGVIADVTLEKGLKKGFKHSTSK